MNTKQTNSYYVIPTVESANPHSLAAPVPRSVSGNFFARVSTVILSIAALLITMSTADARWYKWVDESGNISYQDQPPPANYNDSTQVLNTHGVTVKRIPSREEQQKLEAEARLEAAKNQRDEMLIKSFPAETDLIRTRDKRLGHIDGTVTRMHDQLVILNSRLALIEERIDDRIARGLKPSAALDSDRIAVLRSIDSTNALIKSKLKERRHVAGKFAADLVRYRELATGVDTESQSASLGE